MPCFDQGPEKSHEFLQVSRRPSVGTGWNCRCGHNAYARPDLKNFSDMKPPRFYNNQGSQVIWAWVWLHELHEFDLAPTRIRSDCTKWLLQVPSCSLCQRYKLSWWDGGCCYFLVCQTSNRWFLRQLPHMLQDAEFRQGIAALMARHHVATRSKQSKPAGITEKGSIHVISCLACETPLVTSAYILCFFPCCDLLYWSTNAYAGKSKGKKRVAEPPSPEAKRNSAELESSRLFFFGWLTHGLSNRF